MDLTTKNRVLASLGLISSVENAKPDKEIQHCINKAYKDAIYDFYKHLFKHQFVNEFMSDGVIPVEPNNEIYKEICEKAKDRVVTKPVFVLLTINPKPGITFQELDKKIQKFTKRKFIKSYKYVYEIRKEGGKGLHCHIVLHYTCKPYDLKRASRSTFKDICEVNNPSILNIRYIEPEDLQQKISYIQGNKQDKKLKSVKLTKQWRLENNIQDIYSSEHPLEPKVPLLGCEETIVKTI